MPFGDGTGPRGLGPMTGRQGGICAGYAAAGRANFGSAWVCRGGGRRWRNRYYATGLTGWQRGDTGWMSAGPSFSPDLELATLKTQAENLTRSLDGIRKQIVTLEAQGRKDAQ